MMPCSGKFFLISERIACSAARSAAVTGSNGPLWALFSTPSIVRKNGRIASPATFASSSTKAAKSTAPMRLSPAFLIAAAGRSGNAERGDRYGVRFWKNGAKAHDPGGVENLPLWDENRNR